MTMTGAEILLEALSKEGVELMFGYPGGVLIGFYDKLFDNHHITHILTRHEQGAAHAAEGYARATGKVGVCMGTSGPGATNLVTGIADAYLDSIPLVALTGQVSTDLLGKDAFQEADIIGITRPIAKHSYQVKDIKELAEVVKEAFHIASTGRPGPVVIDLPKDVLNGQLKGRFEYPTKVNLPGYQPNYEGHPMQIKNILHGLSNAKKPLLLIGGGIKSSNAAAELISFAEKTGIPVVSTFMGVGCFPTEHKLNVGWLGMHGSYASNLAAMEADYILAIGTRFSDRSTGDTSKFAPNATIAQIDIDPTSISKNIPVKYPIVGDAKVVLNQFIAYFKEYDVNKKLDARNAWKDQISKWNKERPFSYDKSSSIIKPEFVIESICDVTKGDAIIVTEVGQHQMWAAQFYKFKEPYQFISSGGLGTMGFGLPAAIGAKLGRPDKVVFDIAGDGSILMNIQELTTAVQNRLAIKIAVLNNSFLGMVKQWQHLFFDKRYSQTCMDCQPDFIKVAEGFNCVGLRAEKPEDVEAVLKEAMNVNDRPVLMDFICDRNENVFPMVPAGAPLDKMIFK